jgi:hypothetical protein
MDHSGGQDVLGKRQMCCSEPAKECRPTQSVFIFGGLRTDIESFSVARNDLGEHLVFPVIGGSGGKSFFL